MPASLRFHAQPTPAKNPMLQHQHQCEACGDTFNVDTDLEAKPLTFNVIELSQSCVFGIRD